MHLINTGLMHLLLSEVLPMFCVIPEPEVGKFQDEMTSPSSVDGCQILKSCTRSPVLRVIVCGSDKYTKSGIRNLIKMVNYRAGRCNVNNPAFFSWSNLCSLSTLALTV